MAQKGSYLALKVAGSKKKTTENKGFTTQRRLGLASLIIVAILLCSLSFPDCYLIALVSTTFKRVTCRHHAIDVSIITVVMTYRGETA